MVQTNVLEGAGLPQRPLWVTSGHLRRNRRCPLYPQKRTYAVQLGMSALGHKQTFIAVIFANLCRGFASAAQSCL
jgi:hypothetical protein